MYPLHYGRILTNFSQSHLKSHTPSIKLLFLSLAHSFPFTIPVQVGKSRNKWQQLDSCSSCSISVKL